MFDGSLMLLVKLPFVDTIHPESKKFEVCLSVKIKETGNSNLKGRHARRA